MSEDLDIIKAKIKHAQEWACKHFNAANAADHRIIDPDTLEMTRPAFFVEFPDVDTMVVAPSFFGMQGALSFHYRLAFYPDGSMAWTGAKNPFWGTPMPALKVSEV